MQPRLLTLLACPHCSAALQTEGLVTDGAEIREGTLRCTHCGATFPIVRGIPRFQSGERSTASEKLTARHFAAEFDPESIGADDEDDPAVVEYVFFSRTGIDPVLYQRRSVDDYPVALPSGHYRPDGRYLAGKSVLEGGCGGGRFLRVAAEHADYVVGLELGEHVERAARIAAVLDNVDVVQGSVLEPPFKREVFDFVYSIGVLHHTDDPRRGVTRLADTVRQGAAMAVWVYAPGYWGTGIKRLSARHLHRYLSRKPPAEALAFIRRWLYPLGRAQDHVARRRATKLALAPLFAVPVPRHPKPGVMLGTIFDYYASPVISTHTYPELRAWLTGAGFRRVTDLPVPTACLAQGRGERS